MLRAVIGFGVTIAVGLYYLVTRLVFQVKVLRTSRQFIARETEQHIGTVEISLPDNYSRENLTEPFPRPDWYKFVLEDESILEISCGEVTESVTCETRKILVDVFASLEKAGTYHLTPVFRNDDKVNFIGNSSIEFEVLPSTPCNVTPFKVKRQGSYMGKEDVLYNGGRALLFVKVSDRFGNIVKDELNAEVESEFVTVESCKFDFYHECHVVSVYCKKQGKTTLELKLGSTLKGNIDVNIVAAPIDPRKCRLSLEKRDATIAGEKVRWKLELKDVYGKPGILKNNDQDQNKFSVTSGNITTAEKRSIRVVQDNESRHFLEITPEFAGNRSFKFYLDETPLECESQQIYVTSADLKSISVIEDPVIPGKSSLARESRKSTRFARRFDQISPRSQAINTIYTSESQSISFIGKDKYNNHVVLYPNEWCLNVSIGNGNPDEKDKSVMTILPDKTSDESTLCFSYKFETKGVYNVRMMHKTDDLKSTLNEDVVFPKPLVVKVNQAPLNQNNCQIIPNTTSEVTAGRKFKMTVHLYDIYDKPFILEQCEESIDKFFVKLNDTNNKEDSLKLSSSSNHVCKLEWSPTLAGRHNYTVYFDGRQLGKESFEIQVNPRPLKSLEIVKSQSFVEQNTSLSSLPTMKRSLQAKCSSKSNNDLSIHRSVFTSEEQFTSFQGRDRYDNIVVLNPDEWCLNVIRNDANEQDAKDAVTVLQQTKSKDSTLFFRYYFESKGSYKISVKRKDRVDEESKDDVCLPEPLIVNVLPAPLDNSKCRVTPIEKINITAGDTVKLNVEMYDIYDKPYILEECKENLGKFSMKFNEAQSTDESLKVLLSGGSHIYKLEWTPTVAGCHNYKVYFDGRTLGKDSFEVNVSPRPIKYISVIQPQPSLEDTNLFSCFTSEQNKLLIKGYDEFDNEDALNAEQWSLRGETEDGIAANISQDITSQSNALQFCFSFDIEGVYIINIQNMDGTSNIKTPDSFQVEVKPAPLDHERCKIEQINTEIPVLEQLSIQLKFFDCMSKPFDIAKVEKEALVVKVNGEVTSPVHFLTSPQNKDSNTVNIAVDINTTDQTNVEVSIEYLKKRVAEPITVKIICVQPYVEMDYISYNTDIMNQFDIFNVSRRLLIGDDYANIDNINRVLKKFHIRPKHFFEYPDNCVILNFEEILEDSDLYLDEEKQQSEIEVTFKLVSLFVESVHYRNQAHEMDEERENWKSKSEAAYHRGEHGKAKECSEIKERYSKLMDEAHRKASEAIFNFFNYSRTEKEIDLHGLLVADEDKLQRYANQLRKKFSKGQVQRRVEQARTQMDEAINRLDKLMASQEENPLDWLEIIVGAGHHSQDHHQKIQPKVEKFLKKKNIQFTECNKGSLLITYREYKGKQPCYASFYCKKCDKCWESRSSWKNFWQMCFKCDKEKNVESKCYPLKLRAHSTSQRRANRSVGSGPRFTQEDHKRLCQKCRELPYGQYCDD